jgi:spore coat protein A
MNQGSVKVVLWAALAVGTALVGCAGGGDQSTRRAQIFDQSDGGAGLDPASVPQFQAPLIIPPVMPPTGVIKQRGGKNIDYYEIAVRQFEQQILPAGYGPTTVWSYGSETTAGTYNYPAFTIEAKWRRPTRVKWVNGLVDSANHFLPHLLPVDRTLHWANPMRECISGADKTDCRGYDPTPYLGPVPIVTHVHGAETTEDSDGYPEAWYLPNASDLPGGISRWGSLFSTYKNVAEPLGRPWGPGYATYEYPNDMRATTLWYHDHSLGMTRLNVYAGPAGFYLLRGGPGDDVRDAATMGSAVLPGPAPKLHDKPPAAKRYAEIPIVIQDRSFKPDGSLAYPDNRAFFEGLDPSQLSVPFIPDDALDGRPSDVSPIWNPEFFGNTLVTNGRTWPYLQVEPRRYRLRLLNGCQSRFLILELSNGGTFWQIGADGGFLPAPVPLGRLLVAPAERADVVVDFAGLQPGDTVTLLNLGPDEPFGGGEPGVDFDPADPATTGVVMQFQVVPLAAPDPSTPPEQLVLPARTPLGPPAATRRISLNEEESETVFAMENPDGSLTEVAADASGAFAFGPTAALLGTVDSEGEGVPMLWANPITETPSAGTVEMWEISNFTMDAHPIHIHLVQFEVVGREVMGDGGTSAAGSNAPLSWETGTKDTVIAYPGEITRVKAFFSTAGLYVWHCHILEHEDNEMMRPYCVGDSPGCQRAAELSMPMALP